MTEIAVDTSAIVELMIRGPRAQTLLESMAGAALAYATPVARVEAALVMIGRYGWDRATFDRRWQDLSVQEVPVDAALGSLAINAFERWGKGRAKAALNFGDCFSYALAKARNVPLLCVGNDFSRTDLQTL